MKTIRERINGLSGFREKVKGDANEGKMSSLYNWLCETAGSIEHYAKVLQTNPKAAVKSSTFIMRQAAIVEELLEPLERINAGDMTTEEFVANRANMYLNMMRSMLPTFGNTNMGINLYELKEHQVRIDIYNLICA